MGRFENNIICATGALEIARFEFVENNYFYAIDKNDISLTGKMTLPTNGNVSNNLLGRESIGIFESEDEKNGCVSHGHANF